ncbi:MAG: hypothetical protein KKE51_09475 [Gammaproteobacteria bacterium]|nr:hypothetical protein [Gammaproteobacteria bacterium]MBU1602621.1 hypothetical protein [Gammaproteobacteria bacterium]MBU2433426.1 hypothetical protein [Gammaproteobacteria bacterium]MBU2451342.1 hypothetical protein [Gammaproteobacteria bacterium]
MKALIIAAVAIATTCYAEEAPSPSFSSMSHLCQAEGHKMATYGKCLGEKLDKYRPGWRESGKGYEDAQWIVSFLETLGKRVKKKEISNSEAEILATAEMQAVGSRRLAQQQALEAKQQALVAEQERQRLAAEQNRKDIAERQYQEERRARERSEQLAAIAQIQEEQRRAQTNQMLFDAGMQLMNNSRRYNPPPPMPVTCTSNRWNGMVTTTCQ